MKMQKKEISLAEEEQIDTGCGYGSCKPTALQPCANAKSYTANLSLIVLLHIAFYTYFVGVMRTLEKRFGLSSSQTGLLNSINDFLQLFFVIAIGYLGRNANKARLLSIVVFFTAVAAFIYAVPYFIFGAKDTQARSDRDSMGSSTNITEEQYIGRLCNANFTELCGNEEEKTNLGHESAVAFGVIALGCVIIGIGGSSNSSLGLTYIEENVEKKDSSLYVGVVVSMYPWGPIVGFLLAALCVSLPENLSESPVPQSDPNYVGAWWLGYIIISAAVAVGIVPLFFFPKHLKSRREIEKPATKQTKEGENVVLKGVKEFGWMFFKLLKNKIFWTHTFSQVCSLYVVVGVLIQQPRFLEAHYHQSAGMASIISAVSGAVSGVIGTMLGGFIMRRWELGLTGIASMSVISALVGATGTGIKMLMPCPAVDMVGHRDPIYQSTLLLDSVCNMNCSCGVERMEPICVGGSQTYFSACYAGCTEFDNGTLADCACIDPYQSIQRGTCETTCDLLIPYIVGYFIVTLISLIGRVPATILTFRIVDDEMRSFAIAITGALLSLLVFIPGPILFGSLVDSTCLIWQESCGKTGSCLFYDIDQLRILPHGVTLCFQFAGFLLALLTWWLVKGEKTLNIKDSEKKEDISPITAISYSSEKLKEDKLSSV